MPVVLFLKGIAIVVVLALIGALAAAAGLLVLAKAIMEALS